MSEGAAILVRPAGESDLAEVLKLYAQPEIDKGDVLPLDEAQRLFRRFADYPDYTLFVAEQDGAVVGSFALLVMISLQHLGAPSGIVEDVVVAPDLQGHGIGQSMMRFAIELCRDKGCYKLMLSSNAKRERAHAFYEALGFERHGYTIIAQSKSQQWLKLKQRVRTLARDSAQARSEQDVRFPVQTEPSRDWESGGYLPRLDIQ